MIFFTACEENLDLSPISEPSASAFYRDVDDFELAINGAYNTLRDYSTIQLYLSEVRSDNVYAPGTGVREWNPINNFKRTLATNPLIAQAWDVSYKGIYRANMIIDNISEEVVPDKDTRDRIIGEAKFLRALFYFDLVRYFGKVPLYDKVVTPTEALNIPRTDVDKVYELIEKDLTDAISLLPLSYNLPGKATSNAARALLARVYLTMSGPDYGIEGPGLGVDKYGDALTLLNAIIDGGEYGWVDDYSSIFSYTNENNPDIVFDIQSIDDGATGDRGIGTILPTLMYHESYARINLPFAGGVPNDGSGGIDPSDKLINSFDEGDVRDDFSILMSYEDENGNPVENPQYIKFLDLNHIPADRFNWGINFPVIRYTDVLLMKAEAMLQSNTGTQTEIDALVNQVRVRAGVSKVSNVNMDILLAERQKEFMAEGLRWHDLVRSGKVIDVINAWVDTEDSENKMNKMNADDILYPIHQDQLEVKDGLYKQNKGY
jgi:hypothetical protein